MEYQHECKRKPWNAAHFEDKERTVHFITNYSNVQALPLLGRMPRFKDYNIYAFTF